MAHVVACAGCLDRINHHLDLPPLKTRDPVESNGTRRRRGGGGPGGSGESGGAGGSGSQAGTGLGWRGTAALGPVEHRGAGKGGSAVAAARASSRCFAARATRSRRSSITCLASCASRPTASNSARCRWRAWSPCRNSPCGSRSRWRSSRSSTNAARSSATGRRRCRARACWMTTSRSSCRMDVRSNCACR